MKGVTHKIVHPDFRTAITCDSGDVVLTRHDGGPHFVLDGKDAQATKQLEQLVGRLKDWGHDRARHSDDNWDGKVEFSDDAFAIMKARSSKLYRPNGTLKSEPMDIDEVRQLEPASP